MTETISAFTYKNLYSYCDNNPIVRSDLEGRNWLAVVAIGGAVGALMGGFSSVATGGDFWNGAFKGMLTGTLGSACGILLSPIHAFLGAATGGMIIEGIMQLNTYYIEHNNFKSFEIDIFNLLKTSMQTAVGAAIPSWGNGAEDLIGTIGTSIMWTDAAIVMTSADVIGVNFIRASTKQKSSKGKLANVVNNQRDRVYTSRHYGGYVVY